MFGLCWLDTLHITGKVHKIGKSKVLGTLVDSAIGKVAPIGTVWNCICGTELGIGKVIMGYNEACSSV